MESAVLDEISILPDVAETISVGSAKTHLSALLELVANGREIAIISDGRPKAKLVSAEKSKFSKVFRVMGDYLLKQPIHRGRSADEIIRGERDSRP